MTLGILSLLISLSVILLDDSVLVVIESPHIVALKAVLYTMMQLRV